MAYSGISARGATRPASTPILFKRVAHRGYYGGLAVGFHLLGMPMIA